MFNDQYSLNQAVLDGIKIDTRRIASIQPPYENSEIAFPIFDGEPEESPLWLAYCWVNKDNPEEYTKWIKPKYKVGEVVAIAQSYYEIDLHPNTIVGTKKDGTPITAIQSKGWKNKMFVKAEFMTHQIRITDVCMQELQKISDEDCLAEGVRLFTGNGKNEYVVDGLGHWRSIGCTLFDTPKEAFAALIDKTCGKGTWESNPYVWVYKFELVK